MLYSAGPELRDQGCVCGCYSCGETYTEWADGQTHPCPNEKEFRQATGRPNEMSAGENKKSQINADSPFQIGATKTEEMEDDEIISIVMAKAFSQYVVGIEKELTNLKSEMEAMRERSKSVYKELEAQKIRADTNEGLLNRQRLARIDQERHDTYRQ